MGVEALVSVRACDCCHQAGRAGAQREALRDKKGQKVKEIRVVVDRWACGRATCPVSPPGGQKYLSYIVWREGGQLKYSL